MRRLFTTHEATARGLTKDVLWRGTRTGRWRAVERGVYIVGSEQPTALERAVAVAIASDGVASGTLAGVLLELDGVALSGGPWVTVPPNRSGRRRGVRRRDLPAERITTVKRVRCTDGLQTLIDLAPVLDDLKWEQALESALRKNLTTVAAIEAEVIRRRSAGAARIHRVLSLRPAAAPPTESLLETLMVQLARLVPDLSPPVRQLVVHDEHSRFVARVDLAWPELGIFIELDGQRHKGQPVYDASRETAVVAATGWLCGRFTWTEVVRHPEHTRRRLAQLIEQARRRPIPA